MEAGPIWWATLHRAVGTPPGTSATAICEGAESVQIDGKGATLGQEKPIFFDGMLAQRDVSVEFNLGGGKFDRQKVNLRPRDKKQVTCAR